MICPSCHGSRLKPYPAATTLLDKKIDSLTNMTIEKTDNEGWKSLFYPSSIAVVGASPELLVRVEALLRRSGKLTGETAIHHDGIHFRGKTLEAAAGDQTIALTRREMDIIAYLFRNRHRIVWLIFKCGRIGIREREKVVEIVIAAAAKEVSRAEIEEFLQAKLA